jgi:hypothetical protein
LLLRQIPERNRLKEEDLFWVKVSVHGLLAPCFWPNSEAQQHGVRVQYNKVDHLTAPGSRKLENALLDSSLFHVYSTSATSLLDGTAFKKWSPKTLMTVLQQKTL